MDITVYCARKRDHQITNKAYYVKNAALEYGKDEYGEYFQIFQGDGKTATFHFQMGTDYFFYEIEEIVR